MGSARGREAGESTIPKMGPQKTVSSAEMDESTIPTLSLLKTGSIAEVDEAATPTLRPVKTGLFTEIMESEMHHLVGGKRQEQVLFDVAAWSSRTKGGLNDKDRSKLGQIYGTANSVFEWGLGESTYIAGSVKVPRYAGVDSDPVYIKDVKRMVPDSYRFTYADIGPIMAWGVPAHTLAKNVLDYQFSALATESAAFEVYTVDGRWRVACAVVALLHASARGADQDQVKVLVHDFAAEGIGCAGCEHRRFYHALFKVLKLVDHSGNKLAVFVRKPGVTDEQLVQFWREHKDNPA